MFQSKTKQISKAQKAAQQNTKSYEEYKRLVQNISKLNKEKQLKLCGIEESAPLFSLADYRSKQNAINQEYNLEITKYIEEINSFSFSQLFNAANIMFYKRYLEIVQLYTPYLSKYSFLNKDFVEIDGKTLNIDRELKRTFKQLFKQLKQNPRNAQLMSCVGDLCLDYEGTNKNNLD